MRLNRLAATAALTIALPLSAWAQHGHSKGRESPAEPATAKATKPALKPAEGASIKIVSPIQDQVVKGGTVPVRFKLTRGKRGHHAHAYVDGELMGMLASEKGTLNGIKPGKHVLELRVVTADHATELDATDKVEFSVRKSVSLSRIRKRDAVSFASEKTPSNGASRARRGHATLREKTALE